jgi:hypothetical protein
VPIPVEGGDAGGGAAGTVHDVTSRDTILVKADGSVVDAATISATESVYNISFEFTLPKSDWRAQIIQVSAQNYASYIETIGAHDHVIAAFYATDTNAAGLLVDTLVVVVATENERSTTEVSIPFPILNTPTAFQRIEDAYANMKAIEAIT